MRANVKITNQQRRSRIAEIAERRNIPLDDEEDDKEDDGEGAPEDDNFMFGED